MAMRVVLRHSYIDNLRHYNKPSICHKVLFEFLLILVLVVDSLNGASLNFSALGHNNGRILNDSRYAYTIDPRPISFVAPVQQIGLGTSKNFIDMVSSKNMVSNGGTNLTAITWAHAVNSQQLLTEALNDDIDMIEADIVMGKINGIGADMPVMAHPPANTSDLSLDSFLQQIKAHNDANPQQMKGVKLDFKSIEVFEGSLDTLKEKVPQMTYPIWLNADIIQGPVNQTNTIPVDPDRFFAGSSQFPKAVLSIGWTTKWSSSYDNGSYTPEQIDAMLDAIHRNNVTATGQPITFPVRAGIAANSQYELHNLVKSVNGTNESTLTIWSSQNDYVDVEGLRKLIFSFGFDRIYLDVPDDLSDKLDLSRPDKETEGGGSDGSTHNAISSSLMNFTLISAGLYLISLYMEKIHI
uniref:Menorin-like domain-containing protein n=1 Tax=Haematobia irritans TaxID=7368 RepID=A0A1L8EIP2_HAEIR